jgi:hypothetical protein
MDTKEFEGFNSRMQFIKEFRGNDPKRLKVHETPFIDNCKGNIPPPCDPCHDSKARLLLKGVIQPIAKKKMKPIIRHSSLNSRQIASVLEFFASDDHNRAISINYDAGNV